ncbi:MAG TPA: tyrosine-type recombinase/integrase [Syntrophales bacterium]|nr:tyrosine-type recombinase/integrase [Syntrophales bacterium]
MAKWEKARPGVRYRKHSTRKHGVNYDRYWCIYYKVDGKQVEEALGWSSEGWNQQKALALLVELKENRRRGEGPQTLREKRAIETEKRERKKINRERLKKEAITLEAFFTDTYLPQAKDDKKERSVTREEGLFNSWISPTLGHLPMKDIAPFHLEKLKKTMADGGQSPRSIEYALSVVRQIFNTAKRLGTFEGENPTAKVKFPKPDNQRMRFLTREEADTLLISLKEKSTNVHDMTLLSLHCGLRFGEIASLTWQDVDLERETLTIRDAKAGSDYSFLTKQTAEMLKSRPQGKPSDYVFQGRKGKMDRIPVTFARTVEELKLNEGIDDPRLKICFHSCRHSYASWMIEAGQDLYTVQKLLRHKTNVMTQRYAHIAENRLKNAAKALSLTFQTHKKKKSKKIVNFKE